MADRFDTVIIGGGPGGEVAVNTLLKAGKRVALIENTVLGGRVYELGLHPLEDAPAPDRARGREREDGRNRHASARLRASRRVPRLHGLQP